VLTACTSVEQVGNDWPQAEDPQAQAYLAQCQRDFLQAKDQFKHLEQSRQPYAAQALLHDINALDVTLDGTLSLTSLYANVHPNAAVPDGAPSCPQQFPALLIAIGLPRPLFKHLVSVEPYLRVGVHQGPIEKI